MDTTTLPVQAALLGVAVVLLVALLVIRSRRNGEPVAERPAEKAVKAPKAPKAPKAAKPEKATRRSRRERTVEPAVAEAPEAPSSVPALVQQSSSLELASVVEALRSEMTAYRSQVRLAVAAVASGTGPDDNPQLAVARVAAAIERLDADPSGRAVLPTEVPQSQEQPGEPVQPAAGPAPTLLTEPRPAPVAVPVAPVAVDDDLVLPVPPPEPVQRGGKHRRTAA